MKIIELKREMDEKLIAEIWNQVAAINSALDDAYGSALGGHCGSALFCAAEAIAAYEGLIELCGGTTEQPLREHLRDAIGSVQLDKFELHPSVVRTLEKKRRDAVNPSWGE